MTTYLNDDFVISKAYEPPTEAGSMAALHKALLTVLPEIPQLIVETPLRLWRGAYMEPGLIRIARAYTINKVRYVINLHISRLDKDAMIEPHFHPFGDMAVFLVKGTYTNILGRAIDDQKRVVEPVRICIGEGDTYVMSRKLCHDVEDQSSPTFSIMLHAKSNINPTKPQDYDKIFPLSDEQKEYELNRLIEVYSDKDVFQCHLNPPVLKYA